MHPGPTQGQRPAAKAETGSNSRDVTSTVRSRFKRRLIQLNINKSGLHGLEWKTRDPYSLVNDSLITRTHCIADPPILSSSPRNGSGTAMNADLSLVEQSDSSACPARSLQNLPVRPPIAQSTPSFFCTFLRTVSPRKSRYLNDCGPVAPLTLQGSEENLKKKKDLGSSRQWRRESQ